MSMARIAGVDLPRNKQARIALTYIYGIGNPRAARILSTASVDPFKKVQDLGEDEVNRIRQVIEQEGDVEGDARKDVSMHIKRLIDIQSYRGSRHRRNLPVRGQRSHTNARTRKGPRKGTIAGKKKATKT
jgi:small subunit ribosomal protein S13